MHQPFATRRSLLPLAAVAALCAGAAGQERSRNIQPVDYGGFTRVIAPFLKQHCVDCHGPDLAEAELTLHDLRPEELANAAKVERWVAVLERIESSEMPPPSEPRPALEDQRAVAAWLESQLQGHDVALEHRHYFHKANYVDHRLLFETPAAQPASATPARIWRFSPYLYRQAIDDLTGGTVLVKSRGIKGVYLRYIESPLVLAEPHGVRDYAGRYGIPDAVTEQLAFNGKLTLEIMIAPRTGQGIIRAEARDKNSVEVSGGRRIPEIADLAEAAEPLSAEQIRAAVRFMFIKLLRRDPTADEAQRYCAYCAKSVKTFGNRDGLLRGLTPVFLHPGALFRSEFGGEDAAPDSKMRLLAPAELADAIAYALTDQAPDLPLREAARGGRLNSPADAKREIERLLSDPKVAKPRMLRFFREYFDYVGASVVFKDDSNLSKAGMHKKAYRPSELVEDTDLLVLHFIEQDKAILRNLLTTNLSFVASRYAGWWDYDHSLSGIKGCSKEDLFPIYGLANADKWIKTGPMELPAVERAGILTQPSWLVAHSTNEANNAILRGKWIRERLLGGVIPDVPVGVNAALPDEPNETLRHRMRVTRDESCWKCHERMDPLGLPLEQYDFLGRFRTEELGEPVDVTGAIAQSGDSSLDGPIESPLAMMHKLADSPRVHQVFVRHAFRYWMGRNETRSDAATLQAAYRAYVDSGESLRALIASLLTSDAFLYRTAAPPSGIEP